MYHHKHSPIFLELAEILSLIKATPPRAAGTTNPQRSVGTRECKKEQISKRNGYERYAICNCGFHMFSSLSFFFYFFDWERTHATAYNSLHFFFFFSLADLSYVGFVVVGDLLYMAMNKRFTFVARINCNISIYFDVKNGW
jgi:hypothetical protein